MDRLREYNVTLSGRRTILRPMRAEDKEAMLRWRNKLEFNYYVENERVFTGSNEYAGYILELLQDMFAGRIEGRFNFIIDFDGKPVGGCWLQKLNMPRLAKEFSDLNSRRIDVYVGETEYCGRGIGTEAIRMLTAFAFDDMDADAVFACDVPDFEPGLRRAFEKNGYVLHRENPQPERSRARVTYDLVLMRETYDDRKIF